MKVTFFLLFSLFFFLLPSTFAYVNLRNPCHPNKKLLGKDNDCRVYRIPPKLCQTCKIRSDGYNKAGKFLQCSNIFDLKSDACVSQLKLYAKWNKKCDPLRYDQIMNKFSTSIIKLDYFVYSICEECCDCISTGTKLDQYQQRKKSATLFQIQKRANCGTHAAADICLVWPNVRRVVNWWKDLPKTKEEVDQLPDVCKILRDWREKRKGGNESILSEEERENVPQQALPFLRNFTKVVRCSKKTVWTQCVKLEASQGRI